MKNIIYIILFVFVTTKADAQVLEYFKYNGKQAEIIILPFDFILPDSLVYVTKVRSGDPYLAESPLYKDQLHVICSDAIKAGANIIQMTKFENVKWTNSFNLKGKAYKVKNYEEFKKKVFDKKELETQDMTNFSYVTIYRPNYTYSSNDLYNYKLIINKDTVKSFSNSIFKIRLENEGKTEIQVAGTNIVCIIDVKFGMNYYVCNHIEFPNNSLNPQLNSVTVPVNGYVPILQLVEENIGEIESSLIKKAQKTSTKGTSK